MKLPDARRPGHGGNPQPSRHPRARGQSTGFLFVPKICDMVQ
jgi:hypothetical protein